MSSSFGGLVVDRQKKNRQMWAKWAVHARYYLQRGQCFCFIFYEILFPDTFKMIIHCPILLYFSYRLVSARGWCDVGDVIYEQPLRHGQLIGIYQESYLLPGKEIVISVIHVIWFSKTITKNAFWAYNL